MGERFADYDENTRKKAAKLGTGARFKALKAKLAKRKGVRTPGTLAAGRKRAA